MNPTLFGLIGATATGKTGASIEIARRLRTRGIEVEIIALDSRQLYRGLDVGTGKPTPSERAEVTHHLIDVIDPTDTPDAMQYRQWVEEAVVGIVDRGHVPLLVGGSGFYLRALREGFHTIEATDSERDAVRREVAALSDHELDARLRSLDPVTADRLHANDRYRRGRALEIALLTGRAPSDLEADFEPRPVLGASFELAHLQIDRAALHRRIETRTRNWLDAGWADEVRALLEAGVPPEAPGLQILGYRDVLALVRGECDRATATERIDVGTRRYARSQETWFRKEAVVERGDAARVVETLVGRVVEVVDGSGAGRGGSS
jgi:tRNA dimethylallyltransferase